MHTHKHETSEDNTVKQLFETESFDKVNST